MAIDDNKTIQVKETMQFMEQAHLAPVGDGKLFIICDAATMTIAAQNKMLKTIEDAPGSTSFLLLATSIEPILNTVRSRCVTEFMPSPKSTAPLIPPDIALVLEKIFGIKIDENSLNHEQRYAIMIVQSKLNRNIAANCNGQNQTDLLIMEILKICAKQ